MEKRRRGFGERLRTERERLGYTELQIAQLLGVPLEQYQLYEEGKDDPGIFRMPRLNDCGFDVLFIITSERTIRFKKKANCCRDSENCPTVAAIPFL